MKKLFVLIALIPGLICTAQQKVLPDSLKSFLLQGYEMLDFVEGDLNNDKMPDALLILKDAGEDTNRTEDLKRPFLLLIRQNNGILKLAKRNDQLVMCRYCGGVFGEPYQETTIDQHGFTISFYGGSNWR